MTCKLDTCNKMCMYMNMHILHMYMYLDCVITLFFCYSETGHAAIYDCVVSYVQVYSPVTFYMYMYSTDLILPNTHSQTLNHALAC